MRPAFRRQEKAIWREYRHWRKEHKKILGPSLIPVGTRPLKVLVVAKGTVNGAKVELGLIKGLELAGFRPVVLTDRQFVKYYRLAGATEFIFWDQFTNPSKPEAETAVNDFASLEDLLSFEHAGARVGKFTASAAFRYLRVGRLDLQSPMTRQTIAEHVALGMMRAVAAQRIVREVEPQLALFMGNRYTGQGELMDVVLEHGVDVITWFDAHRSNTLTLKRYTKGNQDQHHASLSDETWEFLRSLPWTEGRRERLRKELHDNYAIGDWYSRGATQFDKQIIDETEIRQLLRLDPKKKTAIVFPHIVWDATLFWGTDLFSNYEEWFIETVRAACSNHNLNWIIKIHPAHVAKSAMDRYRGEPAELLAVRKYIGELPPHVTIIPASSDINTFSLFDVMDYCLTVRGTIGIESASFGIRVLTAGSGRYDRRGFTIDSNTREEYLERLAHLQDLPPLSGAERELAERFAYGAFIMRPLPLQAVSLQYERDGEATTTIRLRAKSSDDLRNSPDLRAFADWAAGAKEDFLWQDAASGPTENESREPVLASQTS